MRSRGRGEVVEAVRIDLIVRLHLLAEVDARSGEHDIVARSAGGPLELLNQLAHNTHLRILIEELEVRKNLKTRLETERKGRRRICTLRGASSLGRITMSGELET